MAEVRNKVIIPIGKHNAHKAEFVSFSHLKDDKEHVALVFKGADTAKVPLVRVHSECLTGDIFHSARCDCGQQLDEAVETMAKSGGIILYLRQEGRGIGLYNKLDAYSLQDTGMNTFEANKALGFDHDLRDFTVATQMLNALNISEIDLLTNNPEKVSALTQAGIKIQKTVPTGIFANQHNNHYLAAKVSVAKHTIALTGHHDESDQEISDKSKGNNKS
ncbi:GTP cyclohydrolase II [Colwellia sp. D2M02]|uniref:GTP cyclohydrolase-2 n=1 Tax=Colwellia asteriadis TaxID=517723 RepID=A0ABP3WGA3_9GAMM|nr:GTP cyclohydrolase II [Colwellia sp. D2M02]MBU2892305.1 GTP cyclohydrolase II [Colwellia sp. D2M02]